MMFPDARPRNVEVLLTGNISRVAGGIGLQIPEGWRVEPEARRFQMVESGEEVALTFRITPPASPARGEVRAVASLDGRKISVGTEVISYPDLPTQTVFPPARAELVRADIRVLAKKVGYVMGAGDEMPQSLRQLGCEVTLLGPGDLARGDLGRFDAIVTGVRAFNVRPDLRANFQPLMDYVHNGGTLVVQYNVLSFRRRPALGKIGPFPLRVGRGRVSVEEAPVTFTNPHHPLHESPNKVTEADFRGWVQERGLYFAAQWDPQYETLFESHDPGEKPLAGGTLFARYGNGAYVFTAYSWFRQLPAGVPGAFRIFANLLSAGKVVE
jgi:hypothetical protein